jgi:hypothetical protein
MKIRPLAADMFHAGAGTDGQTDKTMPIVAFRNFADARKNEFCQNCCLPNHLTSPAGLNFFLLILYAKHSCNNVVAFSNFKSDERFTHESAWHTLLHVNVFSSNTILFAFAYFRC